MKRASTTELLKNKVTAMFIGGDEKVVLETLE
jgi:hypothetical protein